MSNMVVNTNVLALNSHRALKGVGNAQAKSSARLSSGQRINSAADDAAGLAISEKMRAQIKGLDMASRNAQDGISMIQTAEGGMQEITSMAQRMRELVVQAANETNEGAIGTDISKIQEELDQLVAEIDGMAGRVEFNNKTLMNGDLDGTGKEVHLQIGANAGQSINFNVADMRAEALGLDDFKIVDDTGKALSGSDISDKLTTLTSAIDTISKSRASLGSVQNRLEHTIKSLDTSSENLSAAESRIRDTDMAKEMMNLTKSNVLQQAATSMLAQANQAPQNVLQLIQ